MRGFLFPCIEIDVPELEGESAIEDLVRDWVGRLSIFTVPIMNKLPGQGIDDGISSTSLSPPWMESCVLRPSIADKKGAK